LSRIEYDNTVRDLLGDRTRAGVNRLPEEVISPDIAFDNDVSTQQVSAELVAAVETLAQEAAARAVKDPEVRKALLPCAPTDPADAACFKSFVARFGRRAFRRPLTDAEVSRYLPFQAFANEQKDFFAAVELVIAEMLQDPEFIYRIEGGTPSTERPGFYRLNPYEVASRLSYFVLGTTPDDGLLALAEASKLSTPAEIRDAMAKLLADSRARDRVQQFHAEWLGYERSPLAESLASALRKETRALVERVVFERPSSYLDLFAAKETFVDATLAKHYGLAAPPSGWAWVPYGQAKRVGILSHGAALAATSMPGDTSPVDRGRFISTRLMCRAIPPPPANVNVNEDAAPHKPCKKDKLVAHAQSAVCAGCHTHMDPIGFGLENYDREGKYRTTEPGLPACTITGEGTLPEVGPFVGVDGLTRALMTSGRIEDCAVRQLFRFAMGRTESSHDTGELAMVVSALRDERKPLRDLLMAIVSAPSFGYRFDGAAKGK